MSADWKAELEKMKKASKEGINESRKKEEELKEKYEGDREKIMDLVYSQLKAVEETFREEGKAEMDQPKIVKNPNSIYLVLPIVHEQRHISLTISFGLRLVDEGYALDVNKDVYDHTKNGTYKYLHHINPPVKIDGIQKEIRSFLADRTFAIKMLEENTKRWKRRG